ncbi:hypothetical protein [Hugenholtzia roseola]|uniref:hypothetical protein n=1 Tax=Hugenholtzia roseola TaxID=1002 RepID=UPI00041CEF52|nr:hypothetical protein [Hugenholtzia roseola]
MKFDPIKKEVYTDKGEFIKKMNCPYKMNWDNLEQSTTGFRKCANCNHLIVDTELLTDYELLKMVKENPDTCLKIDLNQQNIKLVANGFLEQK